MIAAKDLRIGNYVNTPRKDQNPFRIDGFEYMGKDFGKVEMQTIPNFHPLTWELKDLEPIPLTPEILEKAGFEFVNGYMVNKSKEMCHVVLIEAGDLFKTSVTGPFGMVSTKSLSYVHQLQNLYYSLTGEELTIQL